jgi:hypothetical protein
MITADYQNTANWHRLGNVTVQAMPASLSM